MRRSPCERRRSHIRDAGSAVVAAVLTVAASAHLVSQSAPPTFRTAVDLVRMDVRVIGAHGIPVKYLRADEFVVTDGDRPAPVIFFQHIEEPIGTDRDVAERTMLGEVSTNRGASRGHLYVLVFDQ